MSFKNTNDVCSIRLCGRISRLKTNTREAFWRVSRVLWQLLPSNSDSFTDTKYPNVDSGILEKGWTSWQANVQSVGVQWLTHFYGLLQLKQHGRNLKSLLIKYSLIIFFFYKSPFENVITCAATSEVWIQTQVWRQWWGSRVQELCLASVQWLSCGTTGKRWS